MFHFIILSCMVFMTVIVFASFQSAAGIRNNLRLSVTLPSSRLKDPEVLKIIAGYKKSNLLFLVISLVAALPILRMNYASMMFIYFAIWMLFVFLGSNKIFCRFNNKLLLHKSKNHWFLKEDGIRVLEKEKFQRDRNKLVSLLRKIYPTPLDLLLASTSEPIYVDDDEYWINGVYYNPNDKRTSIDKRVGIGTTVNMATRTGKWSIYGVMVFVVAIYGGIIVLFAAMDYGKMQMYVTDSTITIDAPMYGYSFPMKDIKEVTLVDVLPSHGLRTNGADTGSYLLGNFKYDTYGRTKMYVYTNYPPYLVIRLDRGTVIYNTKDSEKTIDLYEKLIDVNH